MKQYQVLVVGAGPAGLAAAHAAATRGAQVGVIDDNPYPGGQIWRGAAGSQSDPRAAQLLDALRTLENVEFLQQTRVMYAPQPQQLLVQTAGGSATLHYHQLILATGARERLLPFPGWTLPGVTGAGGLQALSKGGYPLEGKRVVVAGSGPLLLAAAATLKSKGAHIVAIIEQAATPSLLRFVFGLLATPAKITQALQLRAQLGGVPYWHNSYVHSAHGDGTLQSVQVQRGYEHELDLLQCDYLACGYGLLPNVELAQALGCATTVRNAQTVVQVDEWQHTSQPGVYCAGEGTGIGGVDLALAEGRIAGLVASGQQAQARTHFATRTRWSKFAERLAHAFALRSELRTLAGDDTIVCRCEDVCHADLRTQTSWRSAKLQTRCGMGPCQGRICGGATEVLYGWRPDAVRLPISPTRISSIID
ncbi:NAD(P)/FAD-dependent oxidoreductase [Duganella sp. sic0402]|uniref:NAD(P)/FAD-dependent oxidoreductase n=1 Tax=Duganella sp. sic0402 TaxID=2854786 RepID=UPI001C4527FC|nr:FAD/NAD(P)-binding oxidoreductase [Duganella sp. sic0402]MBV7537408.1 NAD(P)/FAD-dependent oxidoreductase [Duganella sp. sic0402]